MRWILRFQGLVWGSSEACQRSAQGDLAVTSAAPPLTELRASPSASSGQALMDFVYSGVKKRACTNNLIGLDVHRVDKVQPNVFQIITNVLLERNIKTSTFHQRRN